MGSMTHTMATLAAGLLGTLILSGCGGGDPAEPTARALAADRPQAAAQASSLPDAEAFFDGLEQRYPSLFPRGATTQTLLFDGRNYTLRFYAGTGNHIGLVSGGTVYGLGDFTGGSLASFGSVEPWLCEIKPSTCAARSPTSVRLVFPAGARQCEPGSGTPLLEARRRLTDAGIPVAAAACGFASAAAPAVCGASDLRYWMFDVDASRVEQARGLGFALTDGLYPGQPDALACSY